MTLPLKCSESKAVPPTIDYRVRDYSRLHAVVAATASDVGVANETELEETKGESMQYELKVYKQRATPPADLNCRKQHGGTGCFVAASVHDAGHAAGIE